MANQIDLDEAQIVGFYHAKRNKDDILGLIKSMGLKKREWLKLYNEYVCVGYIDKIDLDEINKHFGIVDNE